MIGENYLFIVIKFWEKLNWVRNRVLRFDGLMVCKENPGLRPEGPAFIVLKRAGVLNHQTLCHQDLIQPTINPMFRQ